MSDREYELREELGVLIAFEKTFKQNGGFTPLRMEILREIDYLTQRVSDEF